MLERARQKLLDLPIREKLMLIIVATATAVLIMGTFAFVGNELVTKRHEAVDDLSTTARIIGSNSTAALAFNDEPAAGEILKALQAKPSIEAAFLYDQHGVIFARYTRGGTKHGGAEEHLDRTLAALLPSGALERSFTDGPHLDLAQAIIVDGDRIGTIQLIKNMEDLRASIHRYLAIAAGVIALSSLVATLLASRLQRVVSHPIANMMRTMTRVSETKDYSLRAEKLGGDELGRLVDGFNDMLFRIEEGTAALEEARAQAEAASRAKSQFLANTSHEIRTPLNGVVGMLKLLRMTPLNEQQSRFVNTAITASDSLLGVINDILDFSKVEAGHLELESVDFDPREATERVVQMFGERASQKGLELAILIHRNVPSLVRGDPNRLGQILTNLVGNAIKFTETGDVVVRATLEAQTETHVTMRFTVSDTGIGITEEQERRLFQAFSQGDASTTRRFGGTGLGLAISKHLAELMGGTIGVEGGSGRGATFWFTVRFEKREETARTTDSRSVRLRGVRVLVVDDSATNREILRQQLSSWGCTVIEAPDGEEALARMRNAVADGTPCNVAVLDAHLPNASGEELAARIKADPSLGRTSLVMLSSLSEGNPGRLRDAGFAACLTKPVRQSELYDAIVAALAGLTHRDAPSPGLTSAARPPKGTSSARVLLADDNEINQALVVEILGAAGQACECVSTGKAALESVRSGRYDLVLMDCQMPVMDGYEATRAIRAWESAQSSGSPGTRRVPIIAITAHALTGDREACIAAGMDDYLSKPLDPERTRATIEAWLERSPEACARHRPLAAPEPAPAGVREAVDFPSLLERCMGNGDLAKRLVTKFKVQAQSDLDELRSAIMSDDVGKTAFVAHRMKGASANLSADGVRSAAARIESMAKNGDLKGAQAELETLSGEIDRLRKFTPESPCEDACERPLTSR